MKKTIFILISLVMIVATVTITGCAGKEKPSIMLVQNDWASQVIATEIMEQIITEQLGLYWLVINEPPPKIRRT